MNRKLQAFLKRVESESLKIEAIGLMQDGRMIFERHWAPDRPRNIYSNTKSFMATAAGVAISEGKLSLSDKLAECFPEAMPQSPPPALCQITLQHLLTMSSGFGQPHLMMDQRRQGIGAPDYLKYMLTQPLFDVPGGSFCYSTADSMLAGRMIEHKVHMNLHQYLYEKLFAPLGIGVPIWECCPQGHPNGGGGLFLDLANMMKLGQLYLNNGLWQGKQLADPQWIASATSKKIETPSDGTNNWVCGYGYQFWMSPYKDAYRADGAFGQITMVLPEKGIVVGVQCPEEGNFEQVRVALDEEVLQG